MKCTRVHLIVKSGECVVEPIWVEHGIFGIGVEVKVLDQFAPQIVDVRRWSILG